MRNHLRRDQTASAHAAAKTALEREKAEALQHANNGAFRFGLDSTWPAAFDADAAAVKTAAERSNTDALDARSGNRPGRGAGARLSQRKEATAMLRDMQVGPAELGFWDSFPGFSLRESSVIPGGRVGP